MKDFLSGATAERLCRLLLASLLLVVLAACSGVTGQSGTSSVTVNVGGSRTAKAMAAIPANVASLVFTISAADITTINRGVLVAGQTAIAESFDVPVGINRLFSVEARDSGGSVLFRGQTYADLNGTAVALSITMSGSVATITVTTDASGRTTAPQALASAAAKVSIPAGTTLTDASGQPIVGSLTATSSFSSDVATLPTAAVATAPSGRTLAAYLDMSITAGSASVKSINPPLAVNMSAGPGALPGSAVAIYSYDSASGIWTLEGNAVVNGDGSVDFLISHLSIWAIYKQVSSTVLRLSSVGAPTGNTLSGVELTIMLPAGVTVNADANGAVASSDIVPSGVAPIGSSIAARYYPAVGPVQPGSVRLSLISSNPFSGGEFATLTLKVAPGTTVQSSSFPISGFAAFDTNGAIISGVTGSLTAQ